MEVLSDNNLENRPIKGKTKSKTPLLDSFGRDLTKMAKENRLDPVIGRVHEIERCSQILTRRKKNNPILIGDPGVGKSAIAEGLAQKIVDNNVNSILVDKRVIQLDIASLVAGTKYRGQFEERLKQVIIELTFNQNIILFIDEIHTIVGAGGASGSLDAANILKPALARGEIQCIGATTLDEYREHIEKDGALERRFQKVHVKPTTNEETLEILQNIAPYYEDFHNVKFENGALEACIKFASRYIKTRAFPDAAIDVMDEAGSKVHMQLKIPQDIQDLEEELQNIKSQKTKVVKKQLYEEAAELRDQEKKLQEKIELLKLNWLEEAKQNKKLVTVDDIARTISSITKIPVHDLDQQDMEYLRDLDQKVKEKIIGQERAIDVITQAIQRSRLGIKDPKKPTSFIFAGSTGVGKCVVGDTKITLRNIKTHQLDQYIKIDDFIKKLENKDYLI